MLKDLAIYIHVPFCTTRCGYCDFCAISIGNARQTSSEQSDQNQKSTPKKALQQLQEFHTTILKEVEMYSKTLQNSKITSVFFGGGTPSLLTPEQIQSVLQGLAQKASFVENAEITLEANPDTLTYEYLEALAKGNQPLTPAEEDLQNVQKPAQNDTESNVSKDMRNLKKTPTVNRVSIGAQSFDANVLKTLDRRHSAEHLKEAFKWAKELGFHTSIDLIYGTPGEDMLSWQNTISETLLLKPDHISAYALTLEPDTRLNRRIASGKLAKVNEDFQAEEYAKLDETLEKAGFHWYEVSNWAKTPTNAERRERGAQGPQNGPPEEKLSSHNLTYWKNGEWLGFGPSAHSHVFISAPETALATLAQDSVHSSEKEDNTPRETRHWNTSNVSEYFKRVQNGESPVEECEKITPEMHSLERAMLFTRLDNVYKPPRVLPSTIAKLIEAGFVDAKTKRLTIRGRMLNDQVIEILATEKRCPLFNTPKCRACPICIMD